MSTLAKAVKNGAKGSDHFQTPPVALEPLIPYLRGRHVWEPACGKGYIVTELCRNGVHTTGTDVLTGEDFLTTDPPKGVSCIVTNPPYSIKDRWLARCYDLGMPFALLMPLTALEGQVRQGLYRKHGVQLLAMPRRVNFETPSTTKGDAWFATAWYTWGLGLESDLVFAPLVKPGGQKEMRL